MFSKSWKDVYLPNDVFFQKKKQWRHKGINDVTAAYYKLSMCMCVYMCGGGVVVVVCVCVVGVEGGGGCLCVCVLLGRGMCVCVCDNCNNHHTSQSSYSRNHGDVSIQEETQ